jgi:hypothetical protein
MLKQHLRRVLLGQIFLRETSVEVLNTLVHDMVCMSGSILDLDLCILKEPGVLGSYVPWESLGVGISF